MSEVGGLAAEAGVRAFAFAEAEALIWGAGWIAPGAPATGVVGQGERAEPIALRLDGAGADEPWQLGGEGTELELEALSEPAWRDPDSDAEGFDQLCRVTGAVRLDGGELEIDCLGWRSARPPGLGRGASSFRLAAAWFEPQEGFALLSLRPKKAKGQDEDQVEAALFDPGAAHPVADPRLSTTYGESGQPTKAGVELWLETEPESDHLYPRRAVGQALAAPAQFHAAKIAVGAQPFRWFSGGREGPGIYLLGQL